MKHCSNGIDLSYMVYCANRYCHLFWLEFNQVFKSVVFSYFSKVFVVNFY